MALDLDRPARAHLTDDFVHGRATLPCEASPCDTYGITASASSLPSRAPGSSACAPRLEPEDVELPGAVQRARRGGR
ncbi:MAG: hypothetical protein INH41_08115 [Myxococcaceae bacterium]|nr:hypothetical protein [Myxococcaceae bacterium]